MGEGTLDSRAAMNGTVSRRAGRECTMNGRRQGQARYARTMLYKVQPELAE